MSKLTDKQKEEFPDSHFAVPETKQLPINDETHTRLAWDMVDRTGGLSDEQRNTARERIKHRAHELGIDTSEWKDKQEAVHCFTAMALNMPNLEGLPNRMPFKGILCRIDEPSDMPPGGAKGRRAYLSKEVAEQALPSLLGMAVDMTDDFDGHDTRNKVGIITEAYIEANAIAVGGFVYSHDFPEEAQRIKLNKGLLGMSYEAQGETYEMPGNIVAFKSCSFTGAAILYKDLAAYTTTSLAASAVTKQKLEKKEMSDTEKNELLAQIELLKASHEELSKKFEESKVNAGSVSHLVKPHSDALRAAASSMCAAGIGNHSHDGHGAVLHRMADHMDAEAAMGKIPHIYRDHDFLTSAADKLKTDNSGETNESIKKLSDELSGLKSMMTDIKQAKFHAAAEPERKTLSPHVKSLLEKSGITASATNELLTKDQVSTVLASAKVRTPEEKARIITELNMAGKLA